MKAVDALKVTAAYLKELQKAESLEVAVGLPVEKASSLIYEDGKSVVTIGAGHEFGVGNLPRRSFLRDTFSHKKKEMKELISSRFKKVALGSKVDKELGLVGFGARNFVIEAFRTDGFWKWPEDTEMTKEAKKRNGKSSETTLVDTGTLRNSITSIVRRSK